MTAGIKANVDGSAAIQVGGTDVITLTSGGAATFVTSPTTVQAGTAAAPSITTSGDTNTGIFFPAADTIAFAEGGVESMRIDSAGNMGIGTSSPTAKVQIFTNGAPASSGNMTTGMAVASAAGSFAINIGADATAQYTWLNSAYINSSNTASPMVFMTGATERMRIDSSGRLGFPGAASAFGAVTIYGQKNGWSGINFNSSAGVNVGTLMIANGVGGFYNASDNAWLGYFNTSGLVLGSSTLINPTGSAPMYTCRAWVNFNGTGTPAIRASGNVSSITDNPGLGDYTVNFATAMPDANYSTVTAAGRNGTGAGGYLTLPSDRTAQTASAVQMYTITVAGNQADTPIIFVAIFR